MAFQVRTSQPGSYQISGQSNDLPPVVQTNPAGTDQLITRKVAGIQVLSACIVPQPINMEKRNYTSANQ